MVGPARKREAVGHLQRTAEMSERRACKVVKQPRSTQRYAVKGDEEEARLREELREISRRRPRAGYRMTARCLRRCGWRVNDKRVQRLWREEGLKVVQKARKCARLGGSEQGSQRLRAGRANEVWSYDFVQDRTRDGRRLKMLCVVDEYTRECLAIHVARRIEAAQVMKVMEGLVVERGAPGHLRRDTGPEFVAKAPSAEWRRDYNEARPHSALGDQTPAEFAKRWRAKVGATPLPSPDSAQPQPNLSWQVVRRLGASQVEQDFSFDRQSGKR